jgi:hypothetical protein
MRVTSFCFRSRRAVKHAVAGSGASARLPTQTRWTVLRAAIPNSRQPRLLFGASEFASASVEPLARDSAAVAARHEHNGRVEAQKRYAEKTGTGPMPDEGPRTVRLLRSTAAVSATGVAVRGPARYDASRRRLHPPPWRRDGRAARSTSHPSGRSAWSARARRAGSVAAVLWPLPRQR